MPQNVDHNAERLLSRRYEQEIFLGAMRQMYQQSFLENQTVFDRAASLTDNFNNICSEAIIQDPSIIKILRYSVSPSISQMKFGQFFGLNSIDKIENRKFETSLSRILLSNLAPKIAQFINENIDESRFNWLRGQSVPSAETLKFAKLWTCSIAADQNAQTRFRNWRKERQELAIKDLLLDCGYFSSQFKGVIEDVNDLSLGEFTTEIRVKGRTRQKADAVCRSLKTGKLVLIEAKAVGVELDATKRIKECCDKASDWRSSARLQAPSVVAVIAGFFNETNIGNLQASDIRIAWEHNLDELRKIL